LRIHSRELVNKVCCRLIYAFYEIYQVSGTKDSGDNATEKFLMPYKPPASISAPTPAFHTTPLQDQNQTTEPSDEVSVEKEPIIPEAKIVSPESISSLIVAKGEKTDVTSNVVSRPILTSKPPGKNKFLELAGDSNPILGGSASTKLMPYVSKVNSEEGQMDGKEYLGIIQPKKGVEGALAEVLKNEELTRINTVTNGEVEPKVLLTQPDIKEDPVTVPKSLLLKPSVSREKEIKSGVYCDRRQIRPSLKTCSMKVNPLPLFTKDIVKGSGEPQPEGICLKLFIMSNY
jgi:hypothetical protein